MGAASAGVTDEDILNDAINTQNVVSYGIGNQAQRFSPLDKVNVDTIKDLVPAWSFSFGGGKQRGQELWEYNHRLPDGIFPCCEVINRGAALYGDLVFLYVKNHILMTIRNHSVIVFLLKKVKRKAHGNV